MEYEKVTTLFDSDEAEYMKEREEKSSYIDRAHYCEHICRCNREKCDRASCPIWKAPEADVAPKSEVESLRAFKTYFDGLYGTGLEVANFHENGQLEPFDNFYDSAVEEMEDHHG